jgi:hypothetical protein
VLQEGDVLFCAFDFVPIALDPAVDNFVRVQVHALAERLRANVKIRYQLLLVIGEGLALHFERGFDVGDGPMLNR